MGEGRYVRPHGFRLDPQGNIWTTDVSAHTVTKMDPRGEVLLRDLATKAQRAVPPFAEIVRSSRGTMHALRRAYDVIARLRGHLVCRFPATADGSASTLR